MAWVGYLNFKDDVVYLIENKVAKLNSSSSKEDWMVCFAGLRKSKYYIWNESEDQHSQLFPSHLWTFLHHAAFHKAPLQLIQMMNIDKYPLSLPDGEGKLAIDHVDASMPQHYKDMLQPVYKYNFIPLELKLIQINFHAVIMDRVDALVEKYNLILPVISVLLEDVAKFDEMYFAVPGMYGGFSFRFEFNTSDSSIIALWTTSSSRIVGNSQQKHKCTADGWTLVSKGSD